MATQQPNVASTTTGRADAQQQSSDLEPRLSSLEQRVERLAGALRKLAAGTQGKGGETIDRSGDEVGALVSRTNAIEKHLSADASAETIPSHGTRPTGRNLDTQGAEAASNVTAQLARSTEHLTKAKRTRVRRRNGKRRSSTPSLWRRLVRPRMS